MHLPAGTVDYQTVKDNLDAMRQPNFEAWMTPVVIPANDRSAVPKKRRSKAASFPVEAELILFPSGVLASNGSFNGSNALAAHLDRIIRDAVSG